MRASLFNVPVRMAPGNDVFVLNTFTDAQVVVSPDVDDLLTRIADEPFVAERATSEQLEAIAALRAEGFVVDDHESERDALRRHFESAREETSQLRVTVLTTMQCNFACDYCVQGDHGNVSSGQRMSLDTAARLLEWIEARFQSLAPASFVLTFFGGEPLLNLPAVYFLAERAWQLCEARRVSMKINVITNGLLLTPEVVDRLLPLGLNGVKVTLDGARDQHNRQRPLRGGQGTFDRIVANIRRVAGRCRVAVGGNFEGENTDSFLELLDYLAVQDFAPLLDKVTFKPVIAQRPEPTGIIPLTLVKSGVAATDHAKRTSACDTCHFTDDQMIALRDATTARGFRTVDGVHMGPCELHRRHAYTVGPDGALYACPGFAGEEQHVVGHITGAGSASVAAAARFDALTPWRTECGDCSFVPVCGGGCSVAAEHESGRLEQASCHKGSFVAGVVTLGKEALRSAAIGASVSS